MNSQNPLRDAAARPSIPSNQVSAGITGNQADGVTLGVEASKDLGKAGELEAQGGISTRTGWGFAAFWRKVWK